MRRLHRGCQALTRAGRMCCAPALTGRAYCLAHDPALPSAVRFGSREQASAANRNPAYPAVVRAEALRIYAERGPAEAARRTGVRSGTIRQWAFRAGVTSPRVVYEWARDGRTWEATLAAKALTELRRAERELARLELEHWAFDAWAGSLPRLRGRREPTSADSGVPVPSG